MELQKHLEDVSAALEEIEDGVKDRQDELDSALDKADNFDRTFQVGYSFLKTCVQTSIR